MASTFEYLDLLAVGAVVSAFGPTAGGASVQVVGDGFRDGATVDFGGEAATSVVFVSEQLLNCDTPPSVTGEGPVDVTVTNPDTSSATLTDGYDYQDADLPFAAISLSCVRYGSVRFSETLGQPRTGSLRTSVEPDATKDVQMIALGQQLFTGVMSKVTQLHEGKPTRLAWNVELTNYVARLNFRNPTGAWTAVSISTIVAEIMAEFADGLVLHVEAGLPATTIELNGTANFSSVLGELASRATAGRGGSPDGQVQWFVDGVDLWFFATYTGPNVPSVLDDANPYLVLADDTPVRYAMDYSQIRNRVTILGPFGVKVTLDDTASQVLFKVRERTYEVTDVDAETAAEVRTLLNQKAQAELLAFRLPIPSLEYAIRDLNHRPGLRVVANLTDPPVVGEFLIQSVEIDQVNIARGIRYESDGTTPLPVGPRVQVQASPVRFGFQDFMRAAALTGYGGAGLPTPNLHGLVEDEDLAGCISSDKLEDSGVTAGTYGGGGSP
jgi:IPT/TIG domain-containing protein